MKHLITVAFLTAFVLILMTEGRYVAFTVLGVMGAAIAASLIDSLQNR
jgi:hypothetical protein